jgi:hypothetical protein
VRPDAANLDADAGHRNLESWSERQARMRAHPSARP